MSEERMVEAIQKALGTHGIEDEIVAAGQFNPRGHSGGLFVGGLAGSEVGGAFGGVGDGVGLAVGSIAGMDAADAASGLPGWMLVVSPPRRCTASPEGRGAKSPRPWSFRSRATRST